LKEQWLSKSTPKLLSVANIIQETGRSGHLAETTVDRCHGHVPKGGVALNPFSTQFGKGGVAQSSPTPYGVLRAGDISNNMFSNQN